MAIKLGEAYLQVKLRQSFAKDFRKALADFKKEAASTAKSLERKINAATKRIKVPSLVDKLQKGFAKNDANYSKFVDGLGKKINRSMSSSRAMDIAAMFRKNDGKVDKYFNDLGERMRSKLSKAMSSSRVMDIQSMFAKNDAAFRKLAQRQAFEMSRQQQIAQRRLQSAARARQERMAQAGNAAGMGIAGMGAASVAVLTAGVYKLTEAFAGLIARGIEVNALLARQSVVLEKLTGSVAVTNRIIRDLRALDVKTPYNVQELGDAARALSATGKVAQYEVVPMVETLGDAAAASAGGLGELPHIVRAIAQMLSKGKIQAQEMTTQLANAGIPAWQLLADAMGTSVEKVHELSEAGKLGVKEIKMLVAQIKKVYGGTAELISQRSLFDAIAKARSQVENMLAEITKPLEESLIRLVNQISDALSGDTAQSLVKSLTTVFEVIAKGVEFFATNPFGQAIIAATALAAGMTLVATAIAGIVAGAVVFPELAMGVAAAALAVVALAPQIAVIAAAVTAFWASLVAAYRAPEAEQFRKNLAEIKSLVFEIGRNIAEGLLSAIAHINNLYKLDFVKFWTFVSGGVRDFLDAISLLTTDLENGFVAAVLSATVAVSGLIDILALLNPLSLHLWRTLFTGDFRSARTKELYKALVSINEILRVERERLRALRASNDAIREMGSLYGDVAQDAMKALAPVMAFLQKLKAPTIDVVKVIAANGRVMEQYGKMNSKPMGENARTIGNAMGGGISSAIKGLFGAISKPTAFENEVKEKMRENAEQRRKEKREKAVEKEANLREKAAETQKGINSWLKTNAAKMPSLGQLPVSEGRKNQRQKIRDAFKSAVDAGFLDATYQGKRLWQLENEWAEEDRNGISPLSELGRFFGGMAGGTGNAAARGVKAAGGVGRFVGNMMDGPPHTSEFIGVAELSKKLQLGILNDEEKKDRKKMVVGIGNIDKGVAGVFDVVSKAVSKLGRAL